MEINELGKHQVFVDIAPHVKSVTINIYKGRWGQGNSGEYRKVFYYDNPSNYEEIRKQLHKIRKKDLSGMAVPSKSNENTILDNCNTIKNKVKQVRLISQEDYLDLIAFLSDMEMTISNNDICLALSRLKDQKKILKEKIGEV